MLLLITVRPESEAPWKDRADIATVALGRLDPPDVETLVHRVTGGRKLPAEVVSRIVAKTDGVPLFVEELTKNVLESGLLIEDGDAYRLDGPLPPLAIPSTLQDSLMAWLDRLAPVREIAQIGAAIGREFGFGLLHSVVGGEEAALKDALGQLEASELVFRSREAPDTAYSFKHALVQDTAYESLLKSRRQVLHRRIATILETQFPSLTETEPEILAHHFSRADLADSARFITNARAIAPWLGRLQPRRWPISKPRLRKQAESRQKGRGTGASLSSCSSSDPAISVVRGVQSPDLEKVYQRPMT
jgi:predicted ATPase